MVPAANKAWALEPAGTYRVGSLWRDDITHGTEEYFFLGPGDPVVDLLSGVGGSLASFPRDCEEEAKKKRDDLAAQFNAANLNRFVPDPNISASSVASAPVASAPKPNAPAVVQPKPSAPSVAPPPKPAPQPAPPPPPPAPSCGSWAGGKDPVAGQPWTISAGNNYAVANVWTNAVPAKSPTWKVFLQPGESISVASGGGDVTYWPGNCGSVADGNYKANGNGVYSEGALSAFINANSAPPPPAPTAPPAPSCNGNQLPSKDRDNGPDTVWTIGGDNRSYVALVWNPERGEGQFKVHVGENTSKTLTGYGGSVWVFAAGCAAESNADYASRAFPPL